MTLFEIIKYDLQDEQIVVYIWKGRKEQAVTIPRDKYEEWLSDSGRLEWVCDSATYNGEHDQKTGVLPIDVYWEDIQNNDLYDWIVINWIAEGVFDIKQPLENVLGGHFYKPLKEAV